MCVCVCIYLCVIMCVYVYVCVCRKLMVYKLLAVDLYLSNVVGQSKTKDNVILTDTLTIKVDSEIRTQDHCFI